MNLASIHDLSVNLLSANSLIESFGLAGLLAIIFAECGILLGCFLPGDTLLFTAGLLVANHRIFHFSLWVLLIATPIAAILGNLVGYWIGYRAGPAVFRRPDSRFFRQEYVDRAHAFFDRFGPITIFLARFVPVVRTVTTVMAGASRMRFSLYAAFSVVGGIVWAVGITLGGYYLGHVKFIADNVDKILVLGVLSALVVIGLPFGYKLWHGRRNGAGSAAGERAADEPRARVGD